MKKTTAFVISHEPDSSRTAKDQATSIIALTLTRALGRQGVRVIRVHPNHLDDSLCSRYSRATEICPDLYESESKLNAFLSGLAEKYPGRKVLVPASDDCSLYIARNANALEKQFILLNPTAATMESVKDKRLQYELATKVGVPIPETYFPENDTELLELAGRLQDYPYIIKPLEAQKWRLRSYASVANGDKVVTVKNRNQLIDEYRRIAAVDSKLMIQEIISGSDEQLYTFLGYCSQKIKPLAHCIRSKLRQSPVDFGYCTATVTCHNDVVEQYSKRLLNQSAYTGIVGIEFKYDPTSQDYKLIEINTRPVNTIGIAAGCGVDLPVIAYRDVLGLAQKPVRNWEDGVIWMRLLQDISAACELRRQGRLTWVHWFRTIRGKRVHALLATDDPLPFIRFHARFLRRQIGKIVSSVRSPLFSPGTRRWLQRFSARIF